MVERHFEREQTPKPAKVKARSREAGETRKARQARRLSKSGIALPLLHPCRITLRCFYVVEPTIEVTIRLLIGVNILLGLFAAVHGGTGWGTADRKRSSDVPVSS